MSLLSLIGLPLFIDSNTANSRDLSWMIRAKRYRYLPRSDPESFDQDLNALRAALTASSTSFSLASTISDKTSSVAGLIVL